MADFKPKDEKCPVCDTKWTKTNFGAKTWYDCKPCGKTAEDIVVVKSKGKSGGTKEYKLDSLDDWESFIDIMNMDDDYDGLFQMEYFADIEPRKGHSSYISPNKRYKVKYMTKAEKFEICNELMRQGVIETNEEFWDFLQGV